MNSTSVSSLQMRDEMTGEGHSPSDVAIHGKKEGGFSLIEVAVAMIVLFVVLLGVAATINYAILYNAGNNSRAQSLDALQQEVERLRSAKFTPGSTDVELQGGSTTRTVPVNGLNFTVTTDVDNDPTTTAIDTEAAVPVTSLKEITITARRADGRNDWTTAVPSRLVLRRVKSN